MSCVTRIACRSMPAIALFAGWLGSSAAADDWERGPKQAKPCTSHKLSTPYRGVGYDHVVTVENTCNHTERCEIKASSNDRAQQLDVPKKSSRSIVVRRGSPAREFSADVTCKKK
ncbi:MAG: hypothetical protein OXU20_12255 [Myxococcales bacterium]|nr:hypothetical protein [Myxococcales bacterium]